MNIILCEYVNKNEYDAGNKARNDVLIIAKRLGYKHVPLYKSGASKPVVVLQIIRGLVSTMLQSEKNDKILIQYPYYPAIVNKILFAGLFLGKKVKKSKLELIVHDVIGLRNEKLDTEEGRSFLASEIMRMGTFDKVICHNETMKKVFIDFSPTINCKVLGPFDYLYDGKTIVPELKYPWKIIVAGSLKQEKCGYLYKLPTLNNIVFELYGSGYAGTKQTNITYHGSYPPDELIMHLNGHFGLVWDGEDWNSISGVYGQYLKYNNPHKFSLYIAAGIPLIVWSQSALANCVIDNNLGICLESLEDLSSVLSNLSFEKYMSMVYSVKKYRKNLVVGNHLKSVLCSD